jgi:hypothetical protein
VADLSRSQISERLERLAEDLDRFPAGVACPWPLSRVFNELVKVVKRDLAQDPVMRSVRLLEEGAGDPEAGSSNAAVGTVRALIGQVLVAYAQTGTEKRPTAAKRARTTQ